MTQPHIPLFTKMTGKGGNRKRTRELQLRDAVIAETARRLFRPGLIGDDVDQLLLVLKRLVK